jgi:hypothetical protein
MSTVCLELPIYQSIKAYVHTEALSAVGLVFSLLYSLWLSTPFSLVFLLQ